jgi:glycosyltransferase involved in cell wall biosynthesis
MLVNKRILLLSLGLARYRYNFTENLAANLHQEADVFAAPYGKNLWEVDFDDLKKNSRCVTYIDFPTSWSQLDSLKPQLLSTTEYHPAMLKALLWARFRNIPVVVTTDLGRAAPYQKGVRLHTRLLHRIMSHFTEGQIAFTPSAIKPYSRSNKPVHFAPHSIDTQDFTPRNWSSPINGSVNILTVARYIPIKGLDLLAKALNMLKDSHSFRWTIIGTGDKSWLKSFIEKYGLTQKTDILGAITGDQLISEYKKGDFFVLPSRSDTYGVVTQEAAACGLPLLISQYAGSSFNLVKPGVNGFVIDPHHTADFTQKLQFMLEHPELWPKYGAESRLLAEKYCVRANAQSTAVWLKEHFLHA